MTLNGVIAVILRYFSEFGSFRGALRKRSRSLSHLLLSSCLAKQSDALAARPSVFQFGACLAVFQAWTSR